MPWISDDAERHASDTTKAKVICYVAARALILASGDDRW